jgi:hypothetical protein
MSRILANQGEIIYNLQQLTSKFDILVNRFKEMEENLVQKLDISNDKNFHEVFINIIFNNLNLKIYFTNKFL